MTSKPTVPTGPRAAKGLRALAELAEGQQLSKADHAAAEYVHKKLVADLGPVWASNLPTDRLGKMVGKQSTQLNTFAAVGITAVKGKPIDLFVVVRQAFDLIAECRKVIEWQRNGGNIGETLAEVDRLSAEVNQLQQAVDEMSDEADEDADRDGSKSGNKHPDLVEAQIRRMQAMAANGELDLREKAGELVRADAIAPILTVVADRIRAASEAIGQQYGPDAQRIISGAIDEAERRLAELRQRERQTADGEPEAEAA